MVRINSVSSVVPSHRISMEEMGTFLLAHSPATVGSRLRRVFETSGNRSRYAALPLDRLARLGGLTERSELYREHATALGERAVGSLVDLGVLGPESISSIVFVSSTGFGAPSIETHLVRRFGLRARCRRIPLTQLGCGGGVAGLSLAAEIVRGDPTQRVLVVSVELPSLQLQLGEPSYPELLAAAQFGDGAAAAVVADDGDGPEVVGTESVLLAEIEEGGRIVPCETGIRLVSSGGLPRLIRSRVRELVGDSCAGHGVDPRMLSYVVAHPRGSAVLGAVAEGLAVGRAMLAASWRAWEDTANMVSASIYRALAELTGRDAPREGDLGMLLAFGTGVACETTLLRWRSAPNVATPCP